MNSENENENSYMRNSIVATLLDEPEVASSCVSKKAMETLDSTKIKCFLNCPRKYFWEYIRGARPQTGFAHLHFGTAFHAAFEAMNRNHLLILDSPTALVDLGVKAFVESYSQIPPDDQDFLTSKGKHVDAVIHHLNTYVAQNEYVFRNMKLLNIEVGGVVPLITSSLTTEFLFVVYKADLIYQLDGKIYIRDYKTGSTLSASWLRQWNFSPQMNLYLYAAKFIYNTPVECLIVDGFFFKPKNFESNAQVSETIYAPRKTTLITVAESGLDILRRTEERLCSNSGIYFPENPESCAAYTGCPYYQLCDSLGSTESESQLLTSRLPLEYTKFEWNPIDELKQTRNIEIKEVI